MMSKHALLVLVGLLAPAAARADGPAEARAEHRLSIPFDGEWKKLMFSGRTMYYRWLSEDGVDFLRAEYRPPWKTVTMARKLPNIPREADRFRFKWRVFKFPVNADETVEGRVDSAASVYLFFKEGVHEYVLKYLYSAAHPKGFNFRDRDSGLLKKLHVIVLEDRAQEAGKWLDEEVRFKDDFRKYFGTKDVPSLRGVGLLSDGDGTKSEVAADYADFRIVWPTGGSVPSGK